MSEKDMPEILRYKCYDPTMIALSTDGDFVSYDMYECIIEAMKAENERLRKALEGILDGSIPISSNRESIKITVGGDEVVFNEEGNKSKNVQDAIEWVLTQLKEKGQ